MSDYSLYSIDSNVLLVSIMLAASDISSFLKMFKHKKDGRADIPSEVRCKLMRVFREKMMLHLLPKLPDGASLSPRSLLSACFRSQL